MEIWKFYFDNFNDAYNYFCEQLDEFFVEYSAAYFSINTPATAYKELKELRPSMRRINENNYEVTGLIDTDIWTGQDLINESWKGLIKIVDHINNEYTYNF